MRPSSSRRSRTCAIIPSRSSSSARWSRHRASRSTTRPSRGHRVLLLRLGAKARRRALRRPARRRPVMRGDAPLQLPHRGRRRGPADPPLIWEAWTARTGCVRPPLGPDRWPQPRRRRHRSHPEEPRASSAREGQTGRLDPGARHADPKESSPPTAHRRRSRVCRCSRSAARSPRRTRSSSTGGHRDLRGRRRAALPARSAAARVW